MEKHRIDFSKLLGFDLVSDELQAGVHFSANTVAARLGAKVGKPLPADAETKIKLRSTNH